MNMEKLYIPGSAKNIDRRIHSHFSKSGHLPKKCYDSVAIIEVCKCQDYATALAFEIYAINKYIPNITISNIIFANIF